MSIHPYVNIALLSSMGALTELILSPASLSWKVSAETCVKTWSESLHLVERGREKIVDSCSNHYGLKWALDVSLCYYAKRANALRLSC